MIGQRLRNGIAVGLMVALGCALGATAAHASGWKRIVNEEGVTVDQKWIKGQDLPIFRGISLIEGTLYDVLTVLDDTPRRTEWVHRCIESRLVKKKTDFARYIYNRTSAPWPVDDRDVVVLTQVRVNPEKGVVRIDFHSQNGIVKEVDDAVRIPRLKGLYLVESVGANHTRVTYQIDSDPGGWLPDWIIERASKKIPLHTLRNLQTQVNKVRRQGGSEAVRARWHARLKKETGQVVPSNEAGSSPPSTTNPQP